MNNFRNIYLRLRPSVSFVPLESENQYQFFLSDIRQNINLEIRNPLYVEILCNLDGVMSFDELINFHKLNNDQTSKLEFFFQFLVKNCILEDKNHAKVVKEHSFRRVLNFISSYIPYHEVFLFWNKLINSKIVIIGAGGVGSWVVSMLSQFGIKNFLIIDDDRIKEFNLNRSLFKCSDLGKYKAIALADMLRTKIPGYYNVEYKLEKLTNPNQLNLYLKSFCNDSSLIINCADFPSVAYTSAIVNECAFYNNLPYIIAGGYNMHLSLIGPTIIPHETPCFHCISHGLESLHVSELENAQRIIKTHRNIGNLAPLACITASFVANETLKLLLNHKAMQPTMFGKRGEFNYLTKKINLEEYSFWDNCPYCCNKH